MTLSELLEKVDELNVPHVLLTGGEPLLQRPVPALVLALKERGYQVSIETHGEVSIESVAPHARIVMDIKTPSSKMSRGNFTKNLPFIKPTDEIKFVIASEQDYFWAKEQLQNHKFPTREVLFSPALPAQNTPSSYQSPSLKWLAERILEDELPVRMQFQLHKLIWPDQIRGV